jgi:hypothetical protein
METSSCFTFTWIFQFFQHVYEAIFVFEYKKRKKSRQYG